MRRGNTHLFLFKTSQDRSNKRKYSPALVPWLDRPGPTGPEEHGAPHRGANGADGGRGGPLQGPLGPPAVGPQVLLGPLVTDGSPAVAITSGTTIHVVRLVLETRTTTDRHHEWCSHYGCYERELLLYRSV